ncbi:MAG: terpene cyclase/mutase family protein [Pirellulales bacterium]|nr:terpene cyclase/mutase family protein [Pirellulales bacterium]
MSQPDSSLASSAGLPPALPVALPLATPLETTEPELAVANPIAPRPATTAKAATATAAAKAAPAKATAPAADLPPLPIAGSLLDDAPAWLISAIVHMLLVIILGLSLVATEGVPNFVLSLSLQDDGGEDLQPGDLDMPIVLDEPPLESGESTTPLEIATDAMETSVEAPPVAALGLETTTDAPAIQIALTGRTAGMKNSLLRAYGGTSSTESAVTEALRWLARNQRKDSLWSLSGAGQYADGANSENPDAATAMALLAFQGAGYTPMSERNQPFTALVTKAWRALLKRQNKDGSFWKEGSSNGRLYTHALCTIALCELYGMTKDSQYRDAAQRAVDYCIKIQAPEGGWRYQPGMDSDTSVTGWFVMALQSARMAGLEVDSPALGRIGDFLDTVSLDGGAEYAYVAGQGKKLSMTAEGLLCRQYLGWSQDDKRLRRGVDVLVSNLPSAEGGRTHVYYWYYAAQACHHMEGEPWRKWNYAMREALPGLQIREGKERGSWDPTLDDTTGVNGGGRLFVTCLAAYSLEVYYRHLPIYQLELMKSAQ